jgi:hypothetical protein
MEWFHLSGFLYMEVEIFRQFLTFLQMPYIAIHLLWNCKGFLADFIFSETVTQNESVDSYVIKDFAV